MDTITMDQLLSLAKDFVVAAIFIAAWWQERKERQVYQREAQARIDATTNQYHDLMKELILYRAAPRFDAPVREKDGQGL